MIVWSSSDEEDDVSRLDDFLDDALEALLKFTAILRSGENCSEVEADDFLVRQHFRNFLVGDALGQAFDDRGLSNAGLSEHDGVVLRFATEDLNDPLNLVVSSDHWIELADPRLLREIDAERLENGEFRVRRLQELVLLLSLGLFGVHRGSRECSPRFSARRDPVPRGGVPRSLPPLG